MITFTASVQQGALHEDEQYTRAKHSKQSDDQDKTTSIQSCKRAQALIETKAHCGKLEDPQLSRAAFAS
jgi:hypothetical protein